MMGKSRFLLVFLCFTSLLLISCGDDKATADNSSKSSSLTTTKVQNPAAPEISVVGNIYAAVNGERRKWYLMQLERNGTKETLSSWRPIAGTNTIEVTLFGLTEKVARPAAKGDLEIKMILTNVDTAAKAEKFEIQLFADGKSTAWSLEHSAGDQLFINRFQMEGEQLDLGGGFYGTVKMADAGDAAPTELPTEFTIKDGIFAVKIPKFKE